MKFTHFILGAFLAAWCSFVAPVFAQSNIIGGGVFGDVKVVSVGGPTVATAFTFSDTGTGLVYTNSTNFNLGTASTDRLVVIAVEIQNGASANVTAVTVNGVSLTPSGTVGTGAAGAGWNTDLYYGLVTTGSGTSTITITTNANINGFGIGIQAWTLKGLATNSPQASATNNSGNSNPIATVTGQILLAGSFSASSSGAYANSAQAPSAFTLGVAFPTYQAHWDAGYLLTDPTFDTWPTAGIASANTTAATFQ